MKRQIKSLAIAATLSLMATSANADPIELFDWAFNIDGGITLAGDPLPGEIAAGGFDFFTGLGTIDITVTGVGAHNIIAFFDHEIEEAINTFFNENVAVFGALGAGQSAEADEPGFLFGDIFDNFLDNTLDNTSGVLPGSEDDASMAIGWDFVLGAGQTAVASFFLSETDDSGSAFVLRHSDDESPKSIFFWSTLDIRGDTVSVPEPGTLGLLGLGLIVMTGMRRRRRMHTI